MDNWTSACSERKIERDSQRERDAERATEIERERER